MIRKTKRVERRGNKQYLIEEGWIRGLRLYSRVLDSEEIPSYVLIDFGCFGDTGGWRSKFAEYIKP